VPLLLVLSYDAAVAQCVSYQGYGSSSVDHRRPYRIELGGLRQRRSAHRFGDRHLEQRMFRDSSGNRHLQQGSFTVRIPGGRGGPFIATRSVHDVYFTADIR
jgi:hypothetical protein